MKVYDFTEEDLKLLDVLKPGVKGIFRYKEENEDSEDYGSFVEKACTIIEVNLHYDPACGSYTLGFGEPFNATYQLMMDEVSIEEFELLGAPKVKGIVERAMCSIGYKRYTESFKSMKKRFTPNQSIEG